MKAKTTKPRSGKLAVSRSVPRSRTVQLSKPAPRSRKVPISRSGTRITDALADRLAREAERGYDLSRGKRVGRKSLTGSSGRSPRVNVRITPELHEQAARRAEREQKSVSELVREALEHYVRRGGD